MVNEWEVQDYLIQVKFMRILELRAEIYVNGINRNDFGRIRVRLYHSHSYFTILEQFNYNSLHAYICLY